jgi:hypothetical protein
MNRVRTIAEEIADANGIFYAADLKEKCISAV